MSSELKLYPYNLGSASSRALANELGITRIKPENSRYNFRPNHLIINWGNSNLSTNLTEAEGRILNHPSSIGTASNKLNTYHAFSIHDIPQPDLTTFKNVANEWLEGGHTVLGRDLMRGSGGRGITVYHPDEYSNLPDHVRHRYYTKYIKKRREFRFHVVTTMMEPSSVNDYSVLFVQEKKRRASENRNDENYNQYIRNHQNEWVFAHNNLDPIPDSLITLAKKAVYSLDLHFGAVDVIYNQLQDQGYVLEVNTACGMEGTTLGIYRNYFREMANRY